jgi:hypothetical protein
MIALVNTMCSSSSSYGRIVSRHLSVSAASAANSRLQRRLKKRYCNTTYLPTVFVELPRSLKGSHAYRAQCRVVTEDD